MKTFFLYAVVLFVFAFATSADASLRAQAGPYEIALSSKPSVIPVGRVNLIFKITDHSGKALDSLVVRAIAQMPGMPMGEKEREAQPVPGSPGTYQMPAAFAMAGSYDVAIKISGPLGESTTTISLQTGQDLAEGAGGGFSIWALLPWLIGAALVVFVVVRMRATGQRIEGKGILNRGTVGGVLLLVGMLAVAIWAVNNLRRQGSMTPLEAQVMEMDTPAPPGTTAVEVANVQRGPISETVRYSGQAAGFIEQDVNPRTTGVVVWMPYYVGQKVKKGQVLARLDTSQLDPQLAERAAMTNMAAQGVGVAVTEYETALSEIAEARAELASKQGMVEEAEAMLLAARQDKSAIEAEVAVMESDVANAEAEVLANRQIAQFRSDELMRLQSLFAQKAVSRAELQEAEAMNADAQAKLHHAHSMVSQALAKVRAAKANVSKAAAMIVAAQKKVRQAQADVRAGQAAVRSKESAANSAKKMISKEQAGVAQARAGYQSAAAQRGYSELKAEVDGVITNRLVGPGTLVNPGQTVLKVAQVSPIRLQANVAEVDVERMQVGSKATVTLRGASDQPIRTRITTVSPALDSQARTGIVEAIWMNADGRVLPGQYLSMEIEVGGTQDALIIPVEALQHSASSTAETFVWVADGDAVHRAVIRTGVSNGKSVEILSGLTEGQKVVTKGASGLREGSQITLHTASINAEGPVIEVSASGFKPSEITVQKGKPVTLTFIRVSEQGCGTEVVFPAFGITKPLPLNKPVSVRLFPEKAGDLNFSCGMNMLKGRVIVR